MTPRGLWLLPLVLILLAPAGHGAPGSRHAAAPAFPGRDPRLLWDAAGRLHVVYVLSEGEGAAAVLYRRLGKDPLGPVRVSPPGLDVAAGRETPPTLDELPDGTLIAGYPVKRPGAWSSELRVQRSTDGGRSWSEPRLLHPSEDGAHSFLSSATSAAGTVAFSWLDKSSGAMGLRMATTRDGLAFTPPVAVDARTCQCCGTAMAAGARGLWVAYRDLEADDLRDFRVLRSTAEPPVFQGGRDGRDSARLSADNWHLKGCPETGARLFAAPDGDLWAAWFTGGGEPGIYVTVSRDGGVRFAPRTLLTPPGQPGKHPDIGRLADGRIAVVYETTGGEVPSLQARIREAGGRWGAPRTLAPTGSYPRLATRGGRTALAFTCPSAREPRVVVADWPDALAGSLPDCAAKEASGP